MKTHTPWTRRNARVRPPTQRESVVEMIGNTPLVRLNGVTRELPEQVEVWAKLEFMNPGGSIKDRSARQIILDAVASGELGRGQTLLDATSGNTGIAYAMLGAALDIPVTLVMPQDTCAQRKHIVQTYGARVILAGPRPHGDGPIARVRELLDDPDGHTYFHANQYANPSNPLGHALTMAPEIWEQTSRRVTHFVCGMGSSGTVMGTGRGLKRLSDGQVTIVGAQPSHPDHHLEGLRHMPSSITPGIFDPSQLDAMIAVDPVASEAMAARVALEEGIAAGDSSGANVLAALTIARGLERGVVVTLICDHTDRYMGLA